MSLLGNDYRKEYVYNLRQKIAQDFELESYINLQEGQNAIIEFELLLAEKVNIECFDKCPFDTNLDLKNFIEKKLEYFHQNYQNVTNVYKLIDYLVDEMIKENFDSEEARLILNAHVYHNFDLFLKSIESYDVWAEFWMVIYLQQYLKINIIIIDSQTYKSIQLGNQFNPEYVSIVLLNINNTHFEPLVRRTEMFYDEEFKNKNLRNNVDLYQRTFTLDELKNII